MNVFDSLALIPAREHTSEIPLQRFLPSFSEQLPDQWLQANHNKGDWILDPFGTSPFLPFTVIIAGYNILVVCNNPILQLYLQVLADAPKKHEFQAALASLAKERYQLERLETHLQSLYISSCPDCSQKVQVEGYIWIKGENYPTAKLLTCKSCGTSGEFPASEEDRQILDSLGKDALHRALAVQKANTGPQIRSGIEDVVETYPTRALYFIFSVINRIDRLEISEYHRKLLYAIMIIVLDSGNAIWPWPPGKLRPKQISFPASYFEHNLWFALENAIKIWQVRKDPVALSIWPDIPSSPGICLFKGRVAELDALKENLPSPLNSVLTVFPRPNQAFWSLSAVWSGWLWGKKSASAMKSALERKRFDWFWFSTAIHQSMYGVRNLLGKNGKFFGFIPEPETGFLTSVLISAKNAGYRLSGVAHRNPATFAQCLWQKEDDKIKPADPKRQSQPSSGLREWMQERNEPAEKPEFSIALLVETAHLADLPLLSKNLPYFTIKENQREIAGWLADSNLIEHYRIQADQHESIMYWLSNLNERPAPTLTDRVEHTILDMFHRENVLSLDRVDHEICQIFRGLQTPGMAVILACIKTHGVPAPHEPDHYKMRPIAHSQAMQEKAAFIISVLDKMGQSLGYQIRKETCCTWTNKQTGKKEYTFFVLRNAILGDLIFHPPQDNGLKIVLYPDHVSPLIQLKLNMNPRLLQAVNRFGKILPFSQLEIFSQQEEITMSDFLAILESRAPTQSQPAQFTIFD